MKTNLSPDEMNDVIRDAIAAEMPAPAGGFASDADAEDHRAAAEKIWSAAVHAVRPDMDSDAVRSTVRGLIAKS